MEVMILARNWGAIAIRGVAAILFGVLTFVVPGLTLTALVLLFGAYALVDGMFNIIAAVRRRAGDPPWWLLLLEGIVGVTAGVVTFVLPALTAATLVYIIAAWAIVTGVLEIVAAIRLRKEVKGEWLLILNGALSLLFGAVLLALPGAGLLVIVWWIGAYAIVFGILLIALAFKLRGRHQAVPTTTGAPRPA